MHIYSLNVNGLRSATRAGLESVLKDAQPDVLCMQETRAPRDYVSDALRRSGFKYITHSVASRPGYGGTCIASNLLPRRVETETGLPQFDAEGRFVFVEFDSIGVISVYVPNGNANSARLKFKLEFLRYLISKCTMLLEEVPHLVICGDFNVAHTEYDVANFKRVLRKSGFLPSERELLDRLINLGLHDPVRQQVGMVGGPYTWWASHSMCRERDIGWRFDYILVSCALENQVASINTHASVAVSDHCPVSIKLESSALLGTR